MLEPVFKPRSISILHELVFLFFYTTVLCLKVTADLPPPGGSGGQCRPTRQKVAGSVFGQGVYRRKLIGVSHTDVSLSLSPLSHQ